MPAPRAVIQSGLENPKMYLEHPDLQIEDVSDIPASFPDLSVAFKLHSECGRLINLFDWLQVRHEMSFIPVIYSYSTNALFPILSVWLVFLLHCQRGRRRGLHWGREGGAIATDASQIHPKCVCSTILGIHQAIETQNWPRLSSHLGRMLIRVSWLHELVIWLIGK